MATHFLTFIVIKVVLYRNILHKAFQLIINLKYSQYYQQISQNIFFSENIGEIKP